MPPSRAALFSDIFQKRIDAVDALPREVQLRAAEMTVSGDLLIDRAAPLRGDKKCPPFGGRNAPPSGGALLFQFLIAQRTMHS